MTDGAFDAYVFGPLEGGTPSFEDAWEITFPFSRRVRLDFFMKRTEEARHGTSHHQR